MRRDPAGKTALRVLLASYELFAACEGYAAISELELVRHLEFLGIRRRGATFDGVRVFTAIPPLRLLTRLEIYGYRLRIEDGELFCTEPTAISDLERRVIERHRHDLVGALRQIEEMRALIRGRSASALMSVVAVLGSRAA